MNAEYMAVTWSEEEGRDTCTRGKRWLTWKVRMNVSLEEDGRMEGGKEGRGGKQGLSQPRGGATLHDVGEEVVMRCQDGVLLKGMICFAAILSCFLSYTIYIKIVNLEHANIPILPREYQNAVKYLILYLKMLFNYVK